MTSISGKTKLIVATIVSAGAYLYYDYYQKHNTFSTSQPMTDDDVKEKFKQAAKNYGTGDQKYKGIYLYSTASDKVYLRSTDGNIYKAGNLSDCPFLLDPNNTVTAYDIVDIYNTFKCTGIPDKYGDKYKAQCDKNPNDDVNILITSAADFEKTLINNSKGDITPDQDVCFDNSEGGNPIANAGINPASNIKDFVKSNTEKIIEFAYQFGAQIAAAKISMLFVFSAYIIPGIINSSGWDKIKQSIMAGQMLLHGDILPWMIDNLQKTVGRITEGITKETVQQADGAIIKISEEVAIQALKEVSIMTTKLALMALESVSVVLDVIAYTQMIGMFIDIFDLCHLNNINTEITQDILDNMAKGNDMNFNMIAGYGVLGEPWDPAYNYCTYDLEPNLCSLKYQNCTKQAFIKGQQWGDGQVHWKDNGEQTQITVDDYCGNITGKDGKFTKYMKDYLNNLKVNHLGQCIKTTTNDDFADILQLYIPSVDWNPIRSINKDNYPLDLYPKSQDLKMLNIFLVNQNTYVAEFVKNNFYYFLSLFIVILLIIFLV